MSNRPEHSRPFNFDDAKKGAPYGTATGSPVEILKWDMHSNIAPILAIVGARQESVAYSREGVNTSYGPLVMLPLAMVEGKPVFAGDKLQYLRNGEIREVAPKDARGWLDRGEWTWPKPAKEYPKTRMSRDQLFAVLTLEEGEYCADDVKFTRRSAEIANAAIARAIDDGDVFTQTHMKGILRQFKASILETLPVGTTAHRVLASINVEEFLSNRLD